MNQIVIESIFVILYNDKNCLYRVSLIAKKCLDANEVMPHSPLLSAPLRRLSLQK